MAPLYTNDGAINAVPENVPVAEDKHGLLESTLKWPEVAVELLVTHIKRSDKYGAIYQAKHCSNGSLLELRVYSFSQKDPSVKKKHLKRNCREWKDRRRFLDSWKENDLVFLILSHPGDWVSSLPLRYHWALVWKRSQRPRSYLGVCLKERREDKEAEEEEEKKGGTVPSPSCSRSGASPGHAGKDQVDFPRDPSDHLRFMLDGKTAAQKERARKIQRKRRQSKRVKARSGKDTSTVPPDAAGHHTLSSSDDPYATELSVPNWDHTYDYTDYPSAHSSIEKDDSWYKSFAYSLYYSPYLDYSGYQPGIYGQTKTPLTQPLGGWGGNRFNTTLSSLEYKPEKSYQQHTPPKHPEPDPIKAPSEIPPQNDPPTPKKTLPYRDPVSTPPKKCGTAALKWSTRQTLVKMLLEYLFSDDNLRKDIRIRQAMDFQGFVPISFLTTLIKIRGLTTEVGDIRLCCVESDLLEVSGYLTGKEYVRRKLGWEEWTLVKEPVAGNGTDIKFGRGNETGSDTDERSETTEPSRDMVFGIPTTKVPSQRGADVEGLSSGGEVELATISVEITEKNYDKEANNDHNNPRKEERWLETPRYRWDIQRAQNFQDTTPGSPKMVEPDLQGSNDKASTCDNESMTHLGSGNDEESAHQGECSIRREEHADVSPKVSHSSKEKAKKRTKQSMRERKSRKR
jgi:hypothetical protein